MDGIERSELVIARILELAMDKGITNWTLEFKCLKLDDQFAEHFLPSVRWLEMEGIIRVESYVDALTGPKNSWAVSPTLTSHGFSELGRRVDLGNGSKPLAEAVKEVSGQNGNFTRAGNFTGGFLASFLKSVG